MSASLRGDFSALSSLVRKLGEVGSARFLRDCNTQFAEEALQRTQDCFEAEASPYGEPWKRAKRRRRRSGDRTPGTFKTLQDTRRLMNSLQAKASASGFEVSTRVEYAAIHNFGGPIQRSPGNLAHHADTGQFLSKSMKGTHPVEVREQGTGAVRISFHGAYTITMPKRQFLPDAQRGLPGDWERAFTELARAMRLATLGR